MIEARDQEWWQTYVVPRVPPSGELPSIDTIKRIIRVPGKVVSVDPLLAETFEAAKENCKEAEVVAEKAKAALLAAAGDADGIEFGDARDIYTYFEQNRAGLDQKRLKIAHPDLFDEFAKTSTFPVLRRVKRR
jgi:hypothetical protein